MNSDAAEDLPVPSSRVELKRSNVPEPKNFTAPLSLPKQWVRDGFLLSYKEKTREVEGDGR